MSKHTPSLVIMAAGMGSRFGGLKQIEPVDPEGHIIIDFSLFDAWRAGFRDVVFIIKREMEGEFRACIGDTIVSMNLWGFSAHMLAELWGRMPAFLTEAMQKNHSNANTSCRSSSTSRWPTELPASACFHVRKAGTA